MRSQQGSPPQPWTAAPTTPARRLRPRPPANPAAATVAAVSAALLIGGSFLQWSVVRFDGTMIRDLSRTGWDEGDGKITVLIGIGGLIAAAAAVVGALAERWLRLGLIVAGGVAILDCLLAFLDATGDSKPSRLADALGIAARGITAGAGIGVLVGALAGLGLVVAGLVMERREPAP